MPPTRRALHARAILATRREHATSRRPSACSRAATPLGPAPQSRSAVVHDDCRRGPKPREERLDGLAGARCTGPSRVPRHIPAERASRRLRCRRGNRALPPRRRPAAMPRARLLPGGTRRSAPARHGRPARRCGVSALPAIPEADPATQSNPARRKRLRITAASGSAGRPVRPTLTFVETGLPDRSGGRVVTPSESRRASMGDYLGRLSHHRVGLAQLEARENVARSRFTATGGPSVAPARRARTRRGSPRARACS